MKKIEKTKKFSIYTKYIFIIILQIKLKNGLTTSNRFLRFGRNDMLKNKRIEGDFNGG